MSYWLVSWFQTCPIKIRWSPTHLHHQAPRLFLFFNSIEERNEKLHAFFLYQFLFPGMMFFVYSLTNSRTSKSQIFFLNDKPVEKFSHKLRMRKVEYLIFPFIKDLWKHTDRNYMKHSFFAISNWSVDKWLKWRKAYNSKFWRSAFWKEDWRVF